MGHLDTVTVDASKWSSRRSAPRATAGYVYGRGAIDDKDNLAAALMTMLLLKRQNVCRSIATSSCSPSRARKARRNLGIGFMVAEHYPEIDAEFCIAEGGDTIREGGEVRYAAVQVTEKIVRGVELTAHGISGHGSVPLASNPIAHLGSAVGSSRPGSRTSGSTKRPAPYFRRLATIAPPGAGEVLPRRDLARPAGGARRGGLAVRARAAPRVDGAHVGVAEHLHRRLSLQRHPLGCQGPARRADGAGGRSGRAARSRSSARSTIRRSTCSSPAAQAARRSPRPGRIQTCSKPSKRRCTTVYQVPTVPWMSTYATDMRGLRARGVQCVGIGSAIDLEDQARGYGMHSDQERLLESEFQRFVRLNWEIVTALARAQ